MLEKQSTILNLQSAIALAFLITGVPRTSSGLPGLTAEEIIERVDENLTVESSVAKAKMVIHSPRRTDVKEMIVYSKGRDKAFVEFLSPARDRGTRYLRLGDDMWMYLPSVEKVIRISGHMLRQSMMGSDFSYEDATERSRKLLDSYSCRLVGTEVLGGTDCYVVELEATSRDVTYYRRKVWVDERRFIGLKEELYSRSGKLLKVLTVREVGKFDGRFYPTHLVMEDKLRKGSRTEMILTDLKLNVRVDDAIFSQRNLRRR